MNTISIEEMKAAVESLADKTDRKQHIVVSFRACFYAHRGHVTTDWQAYVEGTGHYDGETMQDAIGKIDFSPKHLLEEASALETRAANLRKLAVAR